MHSACISFSTRLYESWWLSTCIALIGAAVHGVCRKTKSCVCLHSISKELIIGWTNSAMIWPQSNRSLMLWPSTRCNMRTERWWHCSWSMTIHSGQYVLIEFKWPWKWLGRQFGDVNCSYGRLLMFHTAPSSNILCALRNRRVRQRK